MGAEHILVVEDEKKIADILRDYLHRAGFRVTCLPRGDEAVSRFHSLSPSLVLMDLMLPGMDGLAICREIRKSSDVPIIMVTAKAEEGDRLIGLEVGADDYICKPFSPREVVARVKAVLRRSRTDDASRRHVVGSMILDEGTRQVTVSGNLIDMTPNEFSLFKVLISSPTRVFSRQELLDRAMGYQFDGYERAVDSHIKNLRKKIAKHFPGQEIIQTIYGVGYRLCRPDRPGPEY